MNTARIEEVIGDFVNLKRAGSNMKALSPFANEKTPSFFVSPAKQIFKDFSSGKGGNVVTFLMEHDHLSYPEALRYLAEKYQIDIEEDESREKTEEEKERDNKRESLYIVTQFASAFFTEQLWETEEGKAIGVSYLRERGFDKKTIESFQLGYSPDRWDAFEKVATEKGYKKEYLLETGLVKEGQRGTYDGFKGRVIFPIFNLSGRPIGFGGRTLKKEKNIPKYLNSPESDIYHKSDVLYGLYQAKNEIIKADQCLLVEGYTDVISLHQAGIQNVVASSGTSLTEGQIRLIKRYTSHITILYDGDPAGIKASFRGINLILEQGMQVKVVTFPEGEDPDSFAQKLSEAELREYIESNASDFIRFKTSILLQDTQNDPIKKAALIHDIVGTIALIPDHISRSIYTKECSTLLDIPEEALISELRKIRRSHIDQKQRQQQREQRVAEQETEIKPESFFEQEKELASFDTEFQERDVIRLLLRYGNEYIQLPIVHESGEEEEVQALLAEYIVHEVLQDEITFHNPLYQLIFNEISTMLEEENQMESKRFIHHQEESISHVTSDLLAEKYELAQWHKREIYVETENLKLVKAAHGALFALKSKFVEKQLHDLTYLIKEAHEKGGDYQNLILEKTKLEPVKIRLSKKRGIAILP